MKRIEKFRYKPFLLLLLTAICFTAAGQGVYHYSKSETDQPVGRYTEIFVDSTSSLDKNQILNVKDFQPSAYSILNFAPSHYTIWIRFTVQNDHPEQPLFLYLPYSNISLIRFYRLTADSLQLLSTKGNSLPATEEQYVESPAYVFPLSNQPTAQQTFYLSFRSDHPLQLPLIVANSFYVNKTLNIQSLIVSLYTGLILAIFLYNLFIYISIRDNSYLIYIFYIALLLLAQITNSGYAFYFFWGNVPQLNDYAVPLTTCFAGMAAIFFAISFLRTRFNSKIGHWMFISVIIIYSVAIVFCLTDQGFVAYALINLATLLGALFSIIFSFYIAKKGYRPAYFYFISWIAFSSTIIISIFRNLNFVPHTIFTSYILYIGSAIEAVLLSFALADRINLLRKEKEETQNYALKISRESERLILEQNQMLEQKVAERTDELQNSNHQLLRALDNLKATQLQLVEAEKMASLGQLTAGIAHEINNPINFVKSNIKPLRLDIEDLFSVIKEYENLHASDRSAVEQKLKEVEAMLNRVDLPYIQSEIKSLIEGIEDGAQRTAEIVRGLRIFSRLDESELKVANVHEGIRSTLIILRNSLPEYIKIEKHFAANGNIECQAGKLNQVFLNIINNAIQAIKSKEHHQPEEKIIITTEDIPDNCVKISIKDTGVGMSETVKHKIFEPFFTTKEVGTGTGLGMAIVFKIVQEHNGRIEIISEPGAGAEFIIKLPYTHAAK